MSGKNSGGGGGGGGSGPGGVGFKALGLSDPVYRGVVRMGFRNPTPVQRKALPVVLSGADTVVMARTGSGKTCAFLIPLLETLLANPPNPNMTTRGVRGIVLSPTRELSLQTLKVLKKLGHFTGITSIGIHGSEGMEKQFDALSTNPDVIVATPGRLAHILSEVPDFTLKDCQICILDESDRLMEMGFAVQIRQIAKSLPNDRCQKVLLSATMPKSLVEFTKGGFANDPQVVRLDQEATVSDELRISFITCRSLEKDATLLNILTTIKDDTEANESTRTGLTLVFCATRHHVEFVTTLLRSSGFQATMIYGTLDVDARNSNLAAFRNGKQPILVVTDVAARGVDVPMCDHVIHYHFPPTPKLFVHRSGRVARAGRIGYCWGLVEPDELPYMVDLHLFLGRKLTTANGVTRTSGSIADIGREEKENTNDYQTIEPYTLNEMTPEMVHYGCIPESTLNLEVENVRRIMDAELAGSEQAEIMRSLSKVCENGMKQYRKTRPEASREGVRRAKAILEGLKTETGQRIGGSAIPPHPLLHGLEMAQYNEQKSQGKIGSLNDLENVRKRQEFLHAMSNFRPKETVFEAFATGGGKETGVLSQVDKGRTVAVSKKNDSSYALSAMKQMRRQMKMARDKGSTLVVAGSVLSEEMANATDRTNTKTGIPDSDNDAVESGGNSGGKISSILASENLSIISSSKPRISKAARRRMKKDPDAAATIAVDPPAEKRKKDMRGTDFRDNAFFIDNELAANPEEANRLRQVEAAMQPSAANAINGIQGSAVRLEEAMMDVVGDERDQLVQKQRLMRWDKSKRKYIQTTVGSELSGESWSKRIKLESGQIVKSDKLKLGEVYEKWQKKTNRSVGRNGVFDSNGAPDGEDGLPKQDRRGGKKLKKGGGFDKPKSAQAIKMGRERQQDVKLKNMKKGDRRRIERGNKKEQDGKSKPPAKKGSQGKKGMSGRWKKK